MTFSVPDLKHSLVAMLDLLLVVCSDRYTTLALRVLPVLLVSYQRIKQAVHLSIFLLQLRADSLGQWIRVTPNLHLEWPATNYRHNVVCYAPMRKSAERAWATLFPESNETLKTQGRSVKGGRNQPEKTFTSQNGGHLRMNEIQGSNNWK